MKGLTLFEEQSRGKSGRCEKKAGNLSVISLGTPDLKATRAMGEDDEMGDCDTMSAPCGTHNVCVVRLC